MILNGKQDRSIFIRLGLLGRGGYFYGLYVRLSRRGSPTRKGYLLEKRDVNEYGDFTSCGIEKGTYN